MKKKMITLFAVISAFSALAGCASDEEDSNTRVGGNFISGNKYECGDFRFTISGKYKEDFADDEKTRYLFRDGDDYGDPTIEIKSRTLFYADLKSYLDSIAENTRVFSTGDEDIEITSTDIVTDLECGYSVGAVHFEFSNDTGESCYYIENETRALFIEAEYELSEKKSICKDVEKLISSVEYISDFKLPTEDVKVESKYLSADVPPEWFSDDYEAEEDGKNFIYRFDLFKTRASSTDEEATSIVIKVTEKTEQSPEELAASKVEKIADSKYNKANHIKYEMFGIETECMEMTDADGSSDLVTRMCYFDHGDHSWNVMLMYVNDEELADIEDMLSRIELKP